MFSTTAQLGQEEILWETGQGKMRKEKKQLALISFSFLSLFPWDVVTCFTGRDIVWPKYKGFHLSNSSVNPKVLFKPRLLYSWDSWFRLFLPFSEFLLSSVPHVKQLLTQQHLARCWRSDQTLKWELEPGKGHLYLQIQPASLLQTQQWAMSFHIQITDFRVSLQSIFPSLPQDSI